jgi:hypothetical protein
MSRSAVGFFLGLLLAMLPVNAISVYVLHDVDQDRVGLWNKAFRVLAAGALAFSVVASLLLLIYLSAGRRILRLSEAPTDTSLATVLGASAAVCQYLFDIAATKVRARHLRLHAYRISSAMSRNLRSHSAPQTTSIHIALSAKLLQFELCLKSI